MPVISNLAKAVEYQEVSRIGDIMYHSREPEAEGWKKNLLLKVSKKHFDGLL